jgi:hypothetical protein
MWALKVWEAAACLMGGGGEGSGMLWRSASSLRKFEEVHRDLEGQWGGVGLGRGGPGSRPSLGNAAWTSGASQVVGRGEVDAWLDGGRGQSLRQWRSELGFEELRRGPCLENKWQRQWRTYADFMYMTSGGVRFSVGGRGGGSGCVRQPFSRFGNCGVP